MNKKVSVFNMQNVLRVLAKQFERSVLHSLFPKTPWYKVRTLLLSDIEFAYKTGLFDELINAAAIERWKQCGLYFEQHWNIKIDTILQYMCQMKRGSSGVSNFNRISDMPMSTYTGPYISRLIQETYVNDDERYSINVMINLSCKCFGEFPLQDDDVRPIDVINFSEIASDGQIDKENSEVFQNSPQM